MLADLGMPVLVLAALACTLITVVFMRHISHTLLLGNRPPVFEGIPLIGGLLKFMGVRGGRSDSLRVPALRCLSQVVERVCGTLPPTTHRAPACMHESMVLSPFIPSAGTHAAHEGGVRDPGRRVHGSCAPQAHHLPHWPSRRTALLQGHRRGDVADRGAEGAMQMGSTARAHACRQVLCPPSCRGPH